MRTVPLLAVAVLAFGCASSPFAAPQPTEHERDIERRLVELEKEATKARLEIERLRRRLAELESAQPAPETSAPATAVTSPPESGARSQPAAGRTAPERAGAGIEASDLELERSDSEPAEIDETRAYERALERLRDGDPATAERQLREFLAAHPDSDLADNAWFWIGESRLVRDDVEGALAAYRTGVETYPDGNKTPDALFRIGFGLDRSGRRAEALEVWRELVRRFPGTAAAERAREALGAP